MIVRCNPKCKLSDGQTNGSLDLETNEVVCTECGENICGISEFTKMSMRSIGDVVRKKQKKAFVFKCLTCKKDVETAMNSGVVVGKGCQQKEGKCQINITEHMVVALQSMDKVQKEDEPDDPTS